MWDASVSRKQITRLGKRLAEGAELSPDEQRLLREVIAAFDEAKETVQRRLKAIGIATTGRPKERVTLQEKLARTGLQLLVVDDIAGVRTVVPDGRQTQDEIVARIVEEFAGELAKPVKDRRAEPSHGYRAVHVIVKVDGLRVEVQVRTEAQDLWAQIIEALGGKWGRELRYGEPITWADRPIFPGADMTRQELLEFCLELSENIDESELLRLDASQGSKDLANLRRNFRLWVIAPAQLMGFHLRQARLMRRLRIHDARMLNNLNRLARVVKNLEVPPQ